MASHFNLFRRFWGQWRAGLEAPIKRSGAKLYFPDELVETAQADGSVDFRPKQPLFILNAPQKGSSQKHGPSHRQAIFIDGSFTLRHDAQPPYLRKGTCCVSIFGMDEVPGTSLRLTETDSLHFDMEKIDDHSACHPGFHVQRGASKSLSDAVILALVAPASRIAPGGVTIVRAASLGTPYLRLPTPQMDLFSVMTMVIADFFCSGGPNKARDAAEFKALLQLQADNNNAAREGFAARRIRSHGQERKFMTSGHWYAECV